MKKRISLSRLAEKLVATILVLVPFHAFLTVVAASLVGHYTWLRLWDDLALLILLGICTVWLVRDRALRAELSESLLVRLIVVYCGLTLLLGAVSLLKGDVTLKSLGYGVLVNLRIFVWFLAVLLVAQRSEGLRRSWTKLLLLPAVLVVVFAVLQFTVLPHNLLSHIGYHEATTIAPIETINHDSRYIRVMSTLRGANPLGAYLVVVLCALGSLYLSARKRVIAAIFAVVTLMALFASGSRSAWIGAAIAVAIVGWYNLTSRRQRIVFATLSVSLLVFAAVGFLALRHNAAVQNAVLHTQDKSAVATSSNGAHATAIRQGLTDVTQQPFGDGPGTAGPASIYNAPHPSRVADNYYVQIAQETGWLGLALFLAILVVIASELSQRSATSRLALVLFASFIGLSFVNLLSHAWVDDTLAFVWWGLAGISQATRAKEVTREV